MKLDLMCNCLFILLLQYCDRDSVLLSPDNKFEIIKIENGNFNIYDEDFIDICNSRFPKTNYANLIIHTSHNNNRYLPYINSFTELYTSYSHNLIISAKDGNHSIDFGDLSIDSTKLKKIFSNNPLIVDTYQYRYTGSTKFGLARKLFNSKKLKFTFEIKNSSVFKDQIVGFELVSSLNTLDQNDISIIGAAINAHNGMFISLSHTLDPRTSYIGIRFPDKKRSNYKYLKFRPRVFTKQVKIPSKILYEVYSASLEDSIDVIIAEKVFAGEIKLEKKSGGFFKMKIGRINKEVIRRILFQPLINH